MYKRILVPLDGSRRAETILSHVEKLAHGIGAEIVFIQVVRPPMVIGRDAAELKAFPQKLEKLLEEARQYLEGISGKFSEKGIASRTLVVTGPVVKEIMSAARRKSADLIAICSHGRGGLARLFYGSIAAGILQQADRPLLLIRSRKET
ncbi:MAG: hypothetical protein AMJ54_14450 [Deltaproteobacteria bacterium SG8_13]|nr:MAG: hypothetical protein AMJ54_14450 [Deltaproteobacteria bacterium SG8_13]